MKANDTILNPREKECLYWAANDRTVEETSRILHLSVHSIKKYRKELLQKLGCQSMVGALMIAINEGLISISSK